MPPAAPVASAEAPRTPTGAPAPSDASPAMAATPVATATGAALTWTAPARWQAKPASSMRRGSYTITGEGNATADLAITAFPGDVGGEVANVNRWRGQLALPPLPDAQIAPTVTRLTVGNLKLAVIDLTGTGNGGPARLLGAMVPFGDATWFFKLMGPAPLVAQEKTAFLAFLQSVQPAASTP